MKGNFRERILDLLGDFDEAQQTFEGLMMDVNEVMDEIKNEVWRIRSTSDMTKDVEKRLEDLRDQL